jgi:formylglycine-generating enzyme required for sulfatase activity
MMKKVVFYLTAVAFVTAISCNGDGEEEKGNNAGVNSIAVTDVRLDRSSVMLLSGRTLTLKATVEPLNAGEKAVLWESDAPAVAAVTDGTVTAAGVGDATITVTTKDGGFKEVCFVTVVGLPEMVFVEGGTFQMGCSEFANAVPVHDVTVSSFHIGKYPVTQSQWTAVMDNNPSYFSNNNHPVETVSWDEVRNFITRLNEITGKNYRMPTEAEWEYAARGGNRSKGYEYSGSDVLDDVGWYNDDTTHPVGAKAANELGIYDMSGNVEEWCSDWYGLYSSSAQTDPVGAEPASWRVYRSGSYYQEARLSHVAQRRPAQPVGRANSLGCRLVLP